ncbi:hypothetical protein CVT26_013894 [Gymnopilus dilepis]|uniref:Anaphase-promoting complex subunit 4-like WD40 domain-containing protein n=1 Tax=Gymnopilus dilepis TaxID=231916 RepID=A0A409X5F2_9AGAR|nr:hypothetical protein CVT26_013894 [Gymnopilus dilepis]
MSLLNLTLQPPIPLEEQLHKGLITALSFSPSGNLLASASNDGKLLVFATTSGDLVDCIEMRQRAFSCIVWLSDTRIIVGISTGTILVFDTLEKDLRCNAFRVHRRGVQHMAYQDGVIASATGPEILISSLQDNGMEDEWAVMNTMAHPDSSDFNTCSSAPPMIVTSIHWGARPTSAQPGTLIVGYIHHGISIWDLKTYTLLRTLPGTAEITIGSVALSLEQNLLVLSNDTSSSLDLYNLKYMSKTRSIVSSKPSGMTPLSGRRSPIWHVPVQFAFGGRVIVGGRDEDGNPGIWQLSSETPKQALNHSFSQEDSRSVSAIAQCHTDASNYYTWIATATTLGIMDRAFLYPSVYIWRATKRESPPMQKQIKHADPRHVAKRRRSFQRYSCYILLCFILYVIALAYSLAVDNGM